MITKPGFEFEFDPEACKTCDAACCRGEGGLFMSYSELKTITEYVGGIYYPLETNGSWWFIKSRENKCYFLGDDRPQCSIYPVRPRQCREFPFWADFKEYPHHTRLEECPGIKYKEETK